MARVSLIVVHGTGAGWDREQIDAASRALEQPGHTVEVVAPNGADLDLAGAAIGGIRRASGDVLLVVDDGRGYTPDDLRAVVERLSQSDFAIAVGCRNHVGVRARLGSAVRPLAGSADPLSGLIGLRADAARLADERFKPVGSRFALEILQRVRGTRVDVPVASAGPAGSRPGLRLSDVRQAKRLADDRLGLASRLIQFCVVGASGMVVDLACYALFQRLFAAGPMAHQVAPLVGGPLAPAAAGVVAVAIALTWNFALNRRFTFNDARNRAILPAYFRYALSNMAGVTLSLSLRLCLPNFVPFFAAHRLAAAVVGIVAATGVSFTLTRWFVFGRTKPAPVTPGPIAPKSLSATPAVDSGSGARRGTEVLA